MISKGQKIPSVTLKQVTADGISDVDTAALFAGKKAVMFSLPGAFTPTCSQKHLPSYVEKRGELQAAGVDLVVCLSVNDAFVMQAWAQQSDALGKIVMLADGSAELTKALGIVLDLTARGLGVRANRGVFTIEDGTVTSVEMEAPGAFEVSGADACLIGLKKSA